MSKAQAAPFGAYKGKEPFIFVSYAHEDKEEVFQDLMVFSAEHYRIWYDEGIALTQSFRAEIATAIKRCSFFVVFLSPRAFRSGSDSWVQKEVFLALKEQKQLLAIHLEETELPPELEIELGPKQAAMKYQMSRPDYLRKLKETLGSSFIEKASTEGPVGDLIREIEKIVSIGGDYSVPTLLELSKLLGVADDIAPRVINEALERLGQGEDLRKKEEKFRQLVRFLLKQGSLQESSRQTLANRASALQLASKRWEPIVQEEALAKAKELNGTGLLAEAREILVSAGKLVDQSPQAATFLVDLQGRINSVQTLAREVQLPSKAEPTSEARSGGSRAVTLIEGNVAITWLRIPGGLFVRGCPRDFIRYVETEYHADTGVLQTYPERKEPLDEFWISLTPVTNAQFHAFVRAVGHRYPAGWRGTQPPYAHGDGGKPVTGVSWGDSGAFAAWLGARLPMRAEYEKACRGESGLLFPWGNKFDPSKCNTTESGRGHLLPVGAIPEGASTYGVLDLVGNVWEWAADGEDQLKMTVGASYESTGEIYGVGFFDVSRPPESSDHDLGFRLACSDLRKLIFTTEMS